MHNPGVRERVADQGWRVPQLQHAQVILDVVANQNLILPNNTYMYVLDSSTFQNIVHYIHADFVQTGNANMINQRTKFYYAYLTTHPTTVVI